MKLFYLIKNGISYEFFSTLDHYYNQNIEIYEFQIPVILNKNQMNLLIDPLKSYSMKYGYTIVLCMDRPLRIFFHAIKTDFIVQDYPNIAYDFFENDIRLDDDFIVTPYRKTYVDPDSLKTNDDEYKKHYTKNQIAYSLATLYGYPLYYIPDQRIFYNTKIIEEGYYEPSFSKKERLDVEQLMTEVEKNDFFQQILDMNPLRPTQVILKYATKENIPILKKLYNIKDIKEVKTEKFYHFLNRHPLL